MDMYYCPKQLTKVHLAILSTFIILTAPTHQVALAMPVHSSKKSGT